MNQKELIILHLEDSDMDARLLRLTLNAEGIACRLLRAQNESEYLSLLTTNDLDLILADYSLPSFNGLSALHLAIKEKPEVPFLFVSGAIGEVQAIESLKSGATDYILKDNLKRLGPSIQRALRERDERRMRQQSEAYRNKLATAIEQSGEAVVITDTNAVIQFVNPAFENISGYCQREVIGKTPAILKSEKHDPEFYRHLWEMIGQGKNWSGRFINRRKNGEIYHEDSVISPVKNDAGDIVNYVAVKRDITHEVVLQEKLRHGQKMEAMGVLARGLAHDFNNLLAIILANSELIARDLEDDVEKYDCIKEIYDAVEHGRSLINQLMTFSRRQTVKLEFIDLNQVVGDTIKILKRLLGEDISIHVELNAVPGVVEADIGQLEQIIINLTINSRDAMPDGGRLTLLTSNREISDEQSLHYRDLKAGRYVVIEIKDTGKGIPEEHLPRIYEPFFTTKEPGKGTGLGLSTVYGIVKNFNGYIHVESIVDQGTSFFIFLPHIDMPVSTNIKKLAREESSVRKGHNSILLVEDDIQLRNVLADQLRKNGYNVHTADSAIDAIELTSSLPDNIDLLLTDVILPDINGKELYSKLVVKNEKLKVIYISGNMDGPLIDELAFRSDTVLMEKPFSIHSLIIAIKQILNCS